ncbi:hypothetical protein [Haloferula sp.]|uniref:hypothetical protein n=1 Tax=Haloferula sp. TaxID=2497595 RepID=UPI00329F9DDD
MKKDICSWLRPLRHAGPVMIGLMTTSCFYVWQEPIRYGQMPNQGAQEAAPEPGTLDALQAERDQLENGEAMPEPEAETTSPPPAPAPKPEEVKGIPVAKKVPGREGFVFSPYNNKLIDVKGFPKNSKVRDPHYPASANKFFRVP